MQPGTRNERPFLSRVCGLLGSRGQTGLVRASARCFRNLRPVSLPVDLVTAKRVAVILPEDPFEALHQIGTVVALVSLFRGAETVLICERRIANYFEHVQGVVEIVTYDSAERYLFSRELAALGNMLSARDFDVCVFLERDPDVSLLHLMTYLSPKVRAGYDGSLEYPFVNVRIRTTGKSTHVADENLLIARTLGAKPPPDARWTVSEETVAEVMHAIHEYRIPKKAVLGCVDAGFFFNRFGGRWADLLLDNLARLDEVSWCLYSDENPEGPFLEWLERRGLPTFSAFSPSRCAALVSCSAVVVSGRAVLFELANLHNRPAVGIFDEGEVPRYCKPTPLCMPAAYAGVPDARTAMRVQTLVASLIAPGGRHG